MKLFLFLLSLVNADYCKIRQSDIDEFNIFTHKYDKFYETVGEYFERLNIYMNNRNYIHNRNNQNLSYSLEINKFADMTFNEFSRSHFGYSHNSTFSEKGVLHNMTIPGRNGSNQFIDWRAEGLVEDIKDQGQCGSCWAFSAVVVMEANHARETGKLVSLSEQDLVDCVKDCYGCGGGWPTAAISWVINGSSGNFSKNTSGIDTENSYSYLGIDEVCKFNVSNVGARFRHLVQIPEGSCSHLLDALLSVGPISVAIDAEQDFQFYQTGLFQTQECSSSHLDHAVALVGYGRTSEGKNYYILRNSWNTDWGQDGYMYYSADIDNMCGVCQDASYVL